MFLSDKATWPEIQDMSLDDVDLQCLLLDSLSAYRERVKARQGNR